MQYRVLIDSLRRIHSQLGADKKSDAKLSASFVVDNDDRPVLAPVKRNQRIETHGFQWWGLSSDHWGLSKVCLDIYCENQAAGAEREALKANGRILMSAINEVKANLPIVVKQWLAFGRRERDPLGKWLLFCFGLGELRIEGINPIVTRMTWGKFASYPVNSLEQMRLQAMPKQWIDDIPADGKSWYAELSDVRQSSIEAIDYLLSELQANNADNKPQITTVTESTELVDEMQAVTPKVPKSSFAHEGQPVSSWLQRYSDEYDRLPSLDGIPIGPERTAEYERREAIRQRLLSEPDAPKPQILAPIEKIKEELRTECAVRAITLRGKYPDEPMLQSWIDHGFIKPFPKFTDSILSRLVVRLASELAWDRKSEAERKSGRDDGGKQGAATTGNDAKRANPKRAGRKANPTFEAPPQFNADSKDWMFGSDLGTKLNLSSSTMSDYRKSAEHTGEDKYGCWGIDAVGAFRRKVGETRNVAYYLPRLKAFYKSRLSQAS
ncbi:MAG: hypothetical protein SGI77_08980 [Pirellulaceae bacterium]|nr:hypothetical protein [Pirellulaceae bacterium]